MEIHNKTFLCHGYLSITRLSIYIESWNLIWYLHLHLLNKLRLSLSLCLSKKKHCVDPNMNVRGAVKWMCDGCACIARILHTVYAAVICLDDVIKWKHFPRYWPFVRGIHRSPVNSLHKGQWHGALMYSLVCTWINGWVNNGKAGDLRRYRIHYGIIVMRDCTNTFFADARTIANGYPSGAILWQHQNLVYIYIWDLC